MDHLVSDMGRYVDSISSASAKRLQKAFQRGFNQICDEGGLSILAPLKPLEDVASPTGLVADRVRIDASSGYCNATTTQLRLIGLERNQKEQMKQGILNLQGGKERHQNALQSFWDWLRYVVVMCVSGYRLQ